VKDLDEQQGKLGEQSWKGNMVGYMGHQGYHACVPAHYCIFEVHNVIFKEAMSHQTHLHTMDDDNKQLLADPHLFEDEIAPTPDAEHALNPLRNPTPNPPLPLPHPAPNPNPVTNPLPNPQLLQISHPLPHCSAQEPKHSEGQLHMLMSNQEEEQVRLTGEDLARENKCSSVNAVYVDWESFDTKLLEFLWVFASIVKGRSLHAISWLYCEAMWELEKWLPAMKAEVNQLEERGVWEWVDLVKGECAINSMGVYNVKVDGAGEILKYKDRYVAHGDEMVQGRDFAVKWVMITRIESVQMVFAVVAVQQLHVQQWDFSGVYLNGKMDTTVYMKQPVGFPKQGEESKVSCSNHLIIPKIPSK
jgi:hypothetical protein